MMGWPLMGPGGPICECPTMQPGRLQSLSTWWNLPQPVFPAKAGIHSSNLGVLPPPRLTARIEQLCNRPDHATQGLFILASGRDESLSRRRLQRRGRRGDAGQRRRWCGQPSAPRCWSGCEKLPSLGERCRSLPGSGLVKGDVPYPMHPVLDVPMLPETRSSRFAPPAGSHTGHRITHRCLCPSFHRPLPLYPAYLSQVRPPLPHRPGAARVAV